VSFAAVRGHFGQQQGGGIIEVFAHRERLESMVVSDLMAALILA
jgi:hypothetical protein